MCIIEEKRLLILTWGLLLALLISMAFAAGIGSVSIGLGSVWKIISFKVLGLGNIDSIPLPLVDIVWDIRIPRVI